MHTASMKILCLAGPTASGKSAASMALAQRWPIEIVNVDSATIYRGMDIGTAKPSRQEQDQVRHHLLDILDPAQTYSAAAFCTDALALIRQIHARGHIPVLCGGTMLYYKALREGLSQLPEADPDIRTEIDAEASLQGWPAMHQHLATFDPDSARRLEPNDSQRIQRAIEIYRASGRTMSSWLAEPVPNDASDLRFITLSLEPSERTVLHERIAQRYRAMIEQGLVSEVRTLYERGDLHTGMPSMRCVGYRQIWDHLDGTDTLNDAIEKAIAATRQLAKRQLTWLRAQPDRHRVDCLAPDAVAQVVDYAARVLAHNAPDTNDLTTYRPTEAQHDV